MSTYTVEFLIDPAGDTYAVQLQPAGSPAGAVSAIHYAYGAAIGRHDTGDTVPTVFYRVQRTGADMWLYFTAIGSPDRHTVLHGWDGNV